MMVHISKYRHEIVMKTALSEINELNIKRTLESGKLSHLVFPASVLISFDFANKIHSVFHFRCLFCI